MSSDTTRALLQAVYDRLIAYTSDPDGRKLTDYIDSATPRLWARLSPDSIAYPYVVYRVSLGELDQDMLNLRSAFRVEARCVHRSGDGTVEQMADLVEEALLTWRESSAALGLTYGQTSSRESKEPESDPANRGLAEVTVTVTCVSWMTRLSSAFV